MKTELLRVVISLSGKRQKKIAKYLGVSSSYFCRILKGTRSPSKKIIRKLAKFLKYPDPDELLDPSVKIMVGHA